MPSSKSTLRAFWRRRDGAAAVEFALVCIPLFWLLFGMAEFGAMSLAQTTLDNAVSNVGRKIRTGEAQTTGITQQQIKQEICDDVNRVMHFDCGALWLDVDRYADFAGINGDMPISGGSLNTGGFGYQPGGPDEIVLVRAYYEWRVLTPLFSPILSNIGSDERLLASSMLFRNEPF